MLRALFVTLFISVLIAGYYYNINPYYNGPVTENFDGWKFKNPGKPRERHFFDFLKWRWQANRPDWPDSVENKFNAMPLAQVEGEKLLVTYIGHMSFLLQTAGVNIITDPIFSDRASPVSWAGPKRVHPPGIEWDNLPKVDVVIISHNHYDHMDLPTLEMLYKRDNPLIIVPLGNAKAIHTQIPNANVKELDWRESEEVANGVEVHVDQAHHWSARGVLDRNKALWAAYTIYSPAGKIYFAGDTGYGAGDHFRESYTRHGEYRFAVLPIGAYEPRWFMRYAHMNPEEAIMAYEDLGKPYAVAAHFDVFNLTDLPYGEAGPTFEKEKVARGANKFKILEVGESWDVPEK